MDWRGRLLHLAFPRACAACREDLPYPLQGPLCGPCLRLLEPLRPPWCPRCGAPGLIPARCRRCAGLPADAPLTRAAFRYKAPLPGLLHAFKYRGLADIGRTLGDWMAGAWRRLPELGRPDALVPVPLHPAREAERGFNQARLLAERVAPAARAPVLELARRTRRTAPQARQAREDRGGRLVGAFQADPATRGLRVVIIDDAMTSGETVCSVAAALREAGAADVKAFVLCRA